MQVLEDISSVVDFHTLNHFVIFYDSQGRSIKEKLLDILENAKTNGDVKDFSLESIVVSRTFSGKDGIIYLTFIDSDGKLEHHFYPWVDRKKVFL